MIVGGPRARGPGRGGAAAGAGPAAAARPAAPGLPQHGHRGPARHPARVGPVLAQHIIDYRTQHGGFRSVDELREVNGIGDRRFADLRNLVRP